MVNMSIMSQRSSHEPAQDISPSYRPLCPLQMHHVEALIFTVIAFGDGDEGGD